LVIETVSMNEPRSPAHHISKSPNPDDFLLVGRVARAHGNRGQVIVNLETDFPEARFAVGQMLHVGSSERFEPRKIESVRFHQGRPVIALEGIDSMAAAEALAGAELKVAAADVAPLPEGTFYHHDLIGCEVRDRGAHVIGRVTGVEGTMERSRLVVAEPGGKDVLIPMVAEICVEVDPPSRVIVIDPPEGLLDLNANERSE
jgi:16S rRNA processing protein RimM